MDQGNQIHPETEKVLRAVLDALAVPYAATVAGADERRELISQRAVYLLDSLRHVLNGQALDRELTSLADTLSQVAPINYVTNEDTASRRAQGMTWMEAVQRDG